MAETHYKLSDKQYTLYADARRAATERQAAFESARQQLALIAELLLDFYKIDPQARATVDDATKELVVVLPEPPAAESSPKPKPKRKSAKDELPSGAHPVAEV